MDLDIEFLNNIYKIYEDKNIIFNKKRDYTLEYPNPDVDDENIIIAIRETKRVIRISSASFIVFKKNYQETIKKKDNNLSVNISFLNNILGLNQLYSSTILYNKYDKNKILILIFFLECRKGGLINQDNLTLIYNIIEDFNINRIIQNLQFITTIFKSKMSYLPYNELKKIIKINIDG